LGIDDHQALVAGLLESHGQQLKRYLLARVRNSADVPDIVQEVFLRMMRVPNVESVRSPEAHLFTVAQHVVQ
jgi:RNA polymerase sigma-70 factor (ECF subfamily)